MKKRFACLLSLVLSVSLLSGCNQPSKPTAAPATTSTPKEVVTEVTSDQPVKIVFWHSMGGANGEALDKIINGFNASQSKVIVEGQFQGTYDEAITKLRATGKGDRPDIMQLYDIGTRWMMDSGFALKMQSYIDKDQYDISDYEPNILAYYSIDGALYSMPFNCSSPVLIYNKTALDKAGLDPTTAFATLADAENTANVLREKGGVEVGGSLTNYSWVFEQLLSVQEKEFLNNGNGRTSLATKVVADENSGGVNILNYYKSASLNPNMRIWGKGTTESKKQFATGTVGYIYDSSSIYVATKEAAEGKFEIGFAKLPKVDGSNTGGNSVGGGSLWMIDNGDSNKEAAAWAFIQYATSAQSQAEWAMGTGYIPIRKESVELPAFQAYVKEVNPGMMVAIESLRDSKPNCAGALMGVFTQARTFVENEIEILNEDKNVTPEETMQKIAAQINQELEVYNKTN